MVKPKQAEKVVDTRPSFGSNPLKTDKVIKDEATLKAEADEALRIFKEK